MRQHVIFKQKKTETIHGSTLVNNGVKKVDSAHTDVFASSVEEAKSIQENSQKFEKLVQKSDKVLLKIRAVFPFDFFPDSVVIDESKINIIHKQFFFSSEILSIPIHHIQDIEVDTSIFFATLKILPVGFSVMSYTENWVTVPYLWKRDAIRARRIISGLLIGIKEGIDFGKVDTANFVKKIEKLG